MGKRLHNTSINSIQVETLIQKIKKNIVCPLRFPLDIERVYQRERLKQREKEFFLLGFIALILYNLFNITDRIMLPDISKIALIIRLGIVTPLGVLVLLSQRISILREKIDSLIAILVVIVSWSVILLLLISNSPNVLHYYSGIVLIVLCGNIVFRMAFKCAFFSSLIVFFSYCMAAPFIIKGRFDVLFNSVIVLLSGIVMSLIGSYYLEKEDREKFLLRTKLELDKKNLEEINVLLEKKVKRDPLTKLYNRDFFDYNFNKEWNLALRYKYPIGIIFLDIDDFKAYNDNYGHQAGDYVLKQVSEVLYKNANRFHELPARYGGEEFILLLPHVNLEEALKLGEKIRREVEDLHLVHDYTTYGIVTVSVGVCSVIPRSNLKKEDLVLAADSAMYHSKKTGKNRVTPCNLK